MEQLINIIKILILCIDSYKFKYEDESEFVETFLKYSKIDKDNIENYYSVRNTSFLKNLLIINKVNSYDEIDELLNPVQGEIDDLIANDKFCNNFIELLDKIEKNNYNKIGNYYESYQFNDNNMIKLICEVKNNQIFKVFISFLRIKYKCFIIKMLPYEEQNKKYKSLLNLLIKEDEYKEINKYSYEASRNYLSELKKKKNNEIKRNKKLINTYVMILKDLNTDGIIEYKPYFENINEDLRGIFYKELLQHNEKYYKQISDNIDEFKNNIEKVLKKFNINLSIEDKNKIKDKKNIYNLLNIITKDPFNIFENNNYFIDILLFSNEIILNDIKNLIKLDIIDRDFVLNNLSILLTNENQSNTNKPCLYETFKNNYRILQSKCNLKFIKKTNPDLFTIDTNILKDTLNEFIKYNINLDNYDYGYFKDKNIFNTIDLFIELNMYSYIKDNLQFVYKQSEFIIKRIYISKLIHYPIWNVNNKLNDSILYGYRFPIKNNELDNYISNHTNLFLNQEIIKHFEKKCNNNYYQSLINKLDSKFLNEDNYKINDIIISRNKVIRNICSLDINLNYSNEEIVINSIIYNSILDKDQIEIISSEIKKIFKEKTYKKEKKGIK